MLPFVLWWSILTAPTYNFNELYQAIRTKKMEPKEARVRFSQIIDSFNIMYASLRFVQAPIPVFPLKGYTFKTSYDVTYNDYSDSAYDFFEAAATGHPAIDLTIRDKNKDGLDDKTKKPVQVVSVSEGVVLAVNKKPITKLQKQAGNYIWVYDFYNHHLWYYGFCNKIAVRAGDRVSPGTPIGVVGNLGNMRCKKNGVTRLHLMVFNIDENNLPGVISPVTVLNKIP